MKKFKYGEKEFERNYPNNIAPVVIGKEYGTEKVNLQELENKYDGNKIFSYSTHTFDDETGELKSITYYYIGAKDINAKEYKSIQEYDYEFPPKDMLIETVLQVGNFKRTFYSNVKNQNCSMMDLIDTAVCEIKDKLFEYESEDCILIYLYDDGGWQIDIEIDENTIENLITSIRLVEEV